MKISSINNNLNFGARYKTEDVLRLISNYPYKNKDTDKIIKSLTGIDMYSDEFRKSVTKEESYPIVTFALGDICADKVMQQNPKLVEVRDSFTTEIKLNANKEVKDNFFETQMKKLGKSINLEPFTVTMDEIRKRYSEWIEIIGYSQKLLWEMQKEDK